MLNLYTLHSNPEILDHYDNIDMILPLVFWDKYKNNIPELKKREKYIAKYPEYAYKYAKNILKKPFVLGEPSIAKDPAAAYFYVKNILKKPFVLGEPSIAKNPASAYTYARDVLKNPLC